MHEYPFARPRARSFDGARLSPDAPSGDRISTERRSNLSRLLVPVGLAVLSSCAILVPDTETGPNGVRKRPRLVPRACSKRRDGNWHRRVVEDPATESAGAVRA